MRPGKGIGLDEDGLIIQSQKYSARASLRRGNNHLEKWRWAISVCIEPASVKLPLLR
jgi:hypothetical protein